MTAALLVGGVWLIGFGCGNGGLNWIAIGVACLAGAIVNHSSTQGEVDEFTDED